MSNFLNDYLHNNSFPYEVADLDRLNPLDSNNIPPPPPKSPIFKYHSLTSSSSSPSSSSSNTPINSINIDLLDPLNPIYKKLFTISILNLINSNNLFININKYNTSNTNTIKYFKNNLNIKELIKQLNTNSNDSTVKLNIINTQFDELDFISNTNNNGSVLTYYSFIIFCNFIINEINSKKSYKKTSYMRELPNGIRQYQHHPYQAYHSYENTYDNNRNSWVLIDPNPLPQQQQQQSNNEENSNVLYPQRSSLYRRRGYNPALNDTEIDPILISNSNSNSTHQRQLVDSPTRQEKINPAPKSTIKSNTMFNDHSNHLLSDSLINQFSTSYSTDPNHFFKMFKIVKFYRNFLKSHFMQPNSNSSKKRNLDDLNYFSINNEHIDYISNFQDSSFLKPGVSYNISTNKTLDLSLIFTKISTQDLSLNGSIELNGFKIEFDGDIIDFTNKSLDINISDDNTNTPSNYDLWFNNNNNKLINNNFKNINTSIDNSIFSNLLRNLLCFYQSFQDNEIVFKDLIGDNLTFKETLNTKPFYLNEFGYLKLNYFKNYYNEKPKFKKINKKDNDSLNDFSNFKNYKSSDGITGKKMRSLLKWFELPPLNTLNKANDDSSIENKINCYKCQNKVLDNFIIINLKINISDLLIDFNNKNWNIKHDMKFKKRRELKLNSFKNSIDKLNNEDISNEPNEPNEPSEPNNRMNTLLNAVTSFSRSRSRNPNYVRFRNNNDQSNDNQMYRSNNDPNFNDNDSSSSSDDNLGDQLISDTYQAINEPLRNFTNSNSNSTANINYIPRLLGESRNLNSIERLLRTGPSNSISAKFLYTGIKDSDSDSNSNSDSNDFDFYLNLSISINRLTGEMFLISNNLDKNCWSSIYENGNLFEDSETFWLLYDSIFKDNNDYDNSTNNSKYTEKFKSKINKIIDNSINNNLSFDESEFVINKIKKLLILYLITNPQLFNDDDESPLSPSASSTKSTTTKNKKFKSDSNRSDSLTSNKSDSITSNKSDSLNSNEKDEIEELRKKLLNNLNANKSNYNKNNVLKLTPFINNNSFSSYSYSFS
ncbi:hypothetical protein B5S33_g4495 [[Candida] boidinii]|nr:hypothetical protein B5S33_g4495 [[Candida] boidinii]